MFLRDTKTTVLLLSLTILALFSGISINGQWSWPYELAFFETPRIWSLFLNGKLPQHSSIIALSIHTLSTTLFIIFPFIYHKTREFSNWLLAVGLVFLVVQFELASIFAIIFLPFTIVWIITLIKIRKATISE